VEEIMELGKRMNSKKVQCLNGAQLKAVAFFSMILDHVNNALLVPILEGKGFLLHLSNLLSILGRIAFLLFMLLSLDYDFHAVIVAYLFYIFYQKLLWGAGLVFQYITF
jgi:hypothetical protein